MSKLGFRLFALGALIGLSACTTPNHSKLTLPFKAIGNEPGWSITLQSEQLADVVLDYGERTFAVTLPAPQYTYAGTHYRGHYQNQPLTIDIIEKPCNDTMSDHEYQYEVLFTIEDRALKGCAGLLSTQLKP